MTFYQPQAEWNVAVGTTPATGPAVTPGNLVIVRAIHRTGTNSLPAAVGGNVGSNFWHGIGNFVDGQYVGVVAGGSGDLYMWYCIAQSPITAVNVVINGDASLPRTLFVAEWAGNAAEDVLLDAAARHNESQTGVLPAATVQTPIDGALITGALGATVSTRTFTLLSEGYTAGREYRVSQTTLIAATRPDAPAGAHGPQWEMGGTPSTTGVITAAFRPAGGDDPEPPAAPWAQVYDGTDWQPLARPILL